MVADVDTIDDSHDAGRANVIVRSKSTPCRPTHAIRPPLIVTSPPTGAIPFPNARSMSGSLITAAVASSLPA